MCNDVVVLLLFINIITIKINESTEKRSFLHAIKCTFIIIGHLNDFMITQALTQKTFYSLQIFNLNTLLHVMAYFILFSSFMYLLCIVFQIKITAIID